MAIADVDGDGVADLLTGNGQDDSVSLLLGSGGGALRGTDPPRGRGTVRSPFTSPTWTATRSLDIVTANELSGDVSIRLGRGDGTFAAEQRVAVGDSPYAHRAAATSTATERST